MSGKPFPRVWRLALIPSLMALLLLLLASTVTSTAQASGSDVSSKTVTQSSESAANYWTAERMRTAQPKQVVVRDSLTQPQAQKKPKPQPLAATPVPTSSYSTFPYATIGKVFFTDSRTNTNYVCSGTAVQSSNGSVVDTAGHCVAEEGSGNNYYTNWIFCPQYLDGSCPKGKWTARRLFAHSRWLNNADFAYDLGEAVMNTLNGRTLVATVGGVQYGANLSRSQTWHALGYPAAAPFNGNRMYECVSTKVADDSGSPQPIGISCNMTGGCSGGGWLIQVNGTWYVNGHNDYGYSNRPGVLFSPYYGSAAQSLFNTAQAA